MADYAVNPVDGTRIAYTVAEPPEERAGAQALMLVHGSGLSKAIWRGFGYVKALSLQHRVISVDLRGHGQSGKPHRSQDFAMERVVEDLVAVLDAAGEETVHYFGYSFGARAGFSLAAAQAARMRSFVSAGGTYQITPGSIAALFFPDWEAELESGGMRGFIRGWEAESGTSLDPATRAAFMANDAVSLLAYFRRTETEPGLTEEQVGAIDVPTLLLAGSLDRPRLAASQRAAQLMLEATFQVLDGRNHGQTLYPSAQVLAAVEPFLAQHRHS